MQSSRTTKRLVKEGKQKSSPSFEKLQFGNRNTILIVTSKNDTRVGHVLIQNRATTTGGHCYPHLPPLTTLSRKLLDSDKLGYDGQTGAFTQFS